MLFYGALVSPKSLKELELLPHALVSVSPDTGDILWMDSEVPPHEIQNRLAFHNAESYDLIELKDGEFLMPGFIDTHIHAPQGPIVGLGGEDQLFDWLKHTAAPAEARIGGDSNLARQVYSSVVRRTLDLGTTTACYYATVHLESTKTLADSVLEKGQRALIGKWNLDRGPFNPEESAEASIRDTRQLVDYIKGLRSPLVTPILAPALPSSCTNDLLTQVGKLATENDIAIQLHISEALSDVEHVRKQFPNLPNYASVYDHFHLLRHNTILGHGVHLTDEELVLIKERNAGISHCPTSNFSLRSGVAHVAHWLRYGVKVGLGTDVSGGFSLGMLGTLRDASIASKVVSLAASESDSTFLSVPELVYITTLGGALLCNMSHRIGSLEPGKSFDALIVSTRHDSGNPSLWGHDAPGYQDQETADKKVLQQNLERFLFCGDDRNIKSVYVAGKLVGGRAM